MSLFLAPLLVLLILTPGCSSPTETSRPPKIDIGLPATVLDDHPAWSPDGSSIAYSHFVPNGLDSHHEVYIHDLSTSHSSSLARGSMPAWSPDGGRIAFVREGNLHIFTLATGADTTLVTDGRTYDPVWSRDGTSIAFTTSSLGGSEADARSPGIWILDLRDGRLIQFATAGAIEPVWSLDGSELIFVDFARDGRPGEELYRRSQAATPAIRLTWNSDADRAPSLSPDGDWIVWARSAANPDSTGIFVMHANGSQIRKLADSGRNPSWSPGGERVVYGGHNRTSNTYTLWVVDVATAQQLQLTAP